MKAADVKEVLGDLKQKTGASATLILAVDGRILEEVGDVEGIEKATLAALLGHGMAAFYELSHISKGESGQRVFFSYQDLFYQVICTSISSDHFLTAIFDLQLAPAPPIGTIWFYTKRACERLLNLLGLETPSDERRRKEELMEQLWEEVDDIFPDR